jgi:hypothetical protein
MRRVLLVRLALAEVNVYPLVAPQGDWAGALREVADLSAEDGWALVYAARLLAAAPDPDFWQRTMP